MQTWSSDIQTRSLLSRVILLGFRIEIVFDDRNFDLFRYAKSYIQMRPFANGYLCSEWSQLLIDGNCRRPFA